MKLLHWDKFLTPSMDAEACTQQILIDRYITTSNRFEISPDRQTAFEICNQLGYTPVEHHFGKNWVAYLQGEENFEVVVYLSPRGGHAGKEKILLPVSIASSLYPDNLASRFITGCWGVSTKILRLGIFQLTLKMTSKTSWKSNVDTTSIEVLDHKFLSQEEIQRDQFAGPIWSLDLIQGESQQLAVDFNTSPGLDGIDLQGLYLLDLIQDWFEKVGALND